MRIEVVTWRAFPCGGFEARIAVVSSAFSRGDDEDLDVRAPRYGPGELLHDIDVRVPADGPGGLLQGRVLWSGGANGATQEEGREPRHGAGDAPAARAARAAGVRRNLQEPRHCVHAMGRGGKSQGEGTCSVVRGSCLGRHEPPLKPIYDTNLGDLDTNHLRLPECTPTFTT